MKKILSMLMAMSCLLCVLTGCEESGSYKDTRQTLENASYSKWIADVDGSYGENDFGIFFFTPDGKYVEWTGTYLYSDIPFEVDDPVVSVGG